MRSFGARAAWQAPQSPRAVLAWEEAQLPRRFAASGASGPVLLTEQFLLPAVPGVLDSRELLINVFDLGNGQSAINVNAEVRWASGHRGGRGARDL